MFVELPEAGAEGAFAAYVLAEATRWLGVDPAPALRWFTPAQPWSLMSEGWPWDTFDQHPGLLGKVAHTDANTIWLRQNMDETRLVTTIGHEVEHVRQLRLFGAAIPKLEMEAGAALAGAYVLARWQERGV
jgi:hypothetical protein